MSDNLTQLASDVTDVSPTVESLPKEAEAPLAEVHSDEPERRDESAEQTEVLEAKPEEKTEPRPTPSQTPTTGSAEDLALISGTEPNIERFLEQSYTSPVSARLASRSLIETFDDKGLWLASLVQPSHLAAELRQECSELTTFVTMVWVRQGETQKLKVLSEALLSEPQARRNREAARIMAVLAGILGILRPAIAQKLINAATPYLSDLADGSLMRDAKQWVDAGRVLERTQPEVRIFWNRYLREPRSDWDSSAARLALRNLADVLPEEGQVLEVFQSAVPGYWWDLWRNPRLGHSSRHPGDGPRASTRKAGMFGIGLVFGIVASLTLVWFYLDNDNFSGLKASNPLSASSEPLDVAPSAKVPSLVPREMVATEATKHLQSTSVVPPKETKASAGIDSVTMKSPPSEDEMVPAPPIRDSLRQLQSVLKKTATPMPSGKAVVERVNPITPVEKLVPPSKILPRQPKAEKRADLLGKHAAANADVKRLVGLVKTSSYRENASLIQGENSVAPRGSQTFQNLIRWLILDPPQQADARLAVTKLALHALPIEETVSLFDVCYYPGSDNEIEIKQCASLLLELPGMAINDSQRVLLNKITTK